MKKSVGLILIAFAVTALAGNSCRFKGSSSSKQADLPIASFPYSLEADSVFTMPKALKEISGVSFDPVRSRTAYVIQDEEAVLYTYDFSRRKVVATSAFGEPGDYEDIATDGKFFYVLKSDGTLYTFPFSPFERKVKAREIKDLVPKGEYESIAIDPLNGLLYILCKSCKIDKQLSTLTGYVLKASDGGNVETVDRFSIEMIRVKALDARIKKSIRPSAMAKRVSTDEWYILSSIDKIILLTDANFKPRKILRFSRSDFEQPEGIAFDKNENLYISSEAGKTKAGKIYQFNKKP